MLYGWSLDALTFFSPSLPRAHILSFSSRCKQARAGAEDEEDDEEAVKLIDIKAAAPEEPIVKRKNLVLDWEGKPIPYWLFRLHGLNQTYNCEICGDFIYRGPKVGCCLGEERARGREKFRGFFLQLLT